MNNLDYLNSLPNDSDYDVPERIVCAANQYKDHLNQNVIVAGVRHACNVMYNSWTAYNSGENVVYEDTEVQGFLTNKHRFVDRKEAWKIALEQKQIVRLVGGNLPQGVLYSENLY